MMPGPSIAILVSPVLKLAYIPRRDVLFVRGSTSFIIIFPLNILDQKVYSSQILTVGHLYSPKMKYLHFYYTHI